MRMDILCDAAPGVAVPLFTVEKVMFILRFVPKTGGQAESENDADKSRFEHTHKQEQNQGLSVNLGL
jgi:hypothetical protein